MGYVERQRRWDRDDHCWREVWLHEAFAGRLWITEASDTRTDTLCMLLEGLREEPCVELFIDCAGGEARSWEPCKWLLRRREKGLTTVATVTGKAFSVGLSYLVVCTHRFAVPDARFLVHGESQLAGKKIVPSSRGIEGLVYEEDHYIADWLERFSRRTYEEWLDLVSNGKQCEFGVKEALEWGVIDEVLEGV